MVLKRIARRLLPGVSWQNPVVELALKAVDPLDFAVRCAQGLGHLPAYAIRVRSNGVTRQFGGRRFAQYGRLLANLLVNHASLRRSASVLEIGCGCGRTALALSSELDDCRYVGMDIERLSLDACRKSRILQGKHFRFDYLDVRNEIYNPEGKCSAKVYRFPYDDNEFDVVFLVSVFTHMLTDDVRNYLEEIGRMLKPGCVCMISTFLMDRGKEGSGLRFPYVSQDHHFGNHEMPEAAIGYCLEFYVEQCRSHGMRQLGDPLWGSWRNDASVESSSGFPQDILFFVKQR